MEEYRKIDTKLTGNKNYQILRGVMGQLSDGIWENSRNMESYWKFANIQFEGDKVYINISTKPYKLIKDYSRTLRNKFTKQLFHPNKEQNNPYINMSDDAVKHWFAQKLKQIFQEEYGKQRANQEWRRDNTEGEVTYLNHYEKITVSDVYYAYDTLMNRSTTNKIYSKVNQTFESIMKNFNPKNIL